MLIAPQSFLRAKNPFPRQRVLLPNIPAVKRFPGREFVSCASLRRIFSPVLAAIYVSPLTEYVLPEWLTSLPPHALESRAVSIAKTALFPKKRFTTPPFFLHGDQVSPPPATGLFPMDAPVVCRTHICNFSLFLIRLFPPLCILFHDRLIKPS